MSQKTDNMIRLALVFFVSLLSFSIGTYVGKKYSDNQHKLAALEPKKSVEPAAEKSLEFASDAETIEPEQTLPTGNIEELTTSTGKPAALTDSEVAKIAEEFAAEEEETEDKIVGQVDGEEKTVGTLPAGTKAIKEVPVTAKAPAPTKLAPVAKAPVAAVKPKVTEEKPLASIRNEEVPEITATPTDNREPASIPTKQEVIPMHFTVQIGSFPTQAEAEVLTKSLQGKGYKTSFVPAKVNGQTWYRVNVGLFGTIREAQDYKKEFLEKTKMTSAIVQRVQ
jgi:cell division protein FtsN